MQRRAKMAVLLLAVILSAGTLSAKQRVTGYGTVFSGKETGISAVLDRGRSAMHLSLMCDLRGLLRGNVSSPGIKAIYNIEYSLRSWRISEECEIRYFAGPGISFGYVADTDNNRFGGMAALYGNTGFSFNFSSDIAIKLYLSGELGFHLDMNSTFDTSMRVYSAGLRNVLYPQLSIIYSF